MDILQRKQFEALAGYRAPWCVSVFLPTFRIGSEGLQNAVRLKNLLKTAETELVERGMRAPEARQYLAPAVELMENGAFWKGVSEGVALFLGEQPMLALRLPLQFPELAVVGKRFHVTPLLPLVTPEGEFHLLAVSANKARLLEGSRWRIAPVELTSLPKSLSEALNYDQPEVVRQCHSAGPAAQHRVGLAFHGQGGSVDVAKAEVAEYFRGIDRALQKYLAERKTPLLFAGVDSLFPLYRQVNSYAHLQPTHISGNTDTWSEADLHDAAWQIVEPLFRQDERNAIARWQQVDATSHGSHELFEVLRAASHGSVEALLVDPARRQWGVFDGDTSNLMLHDGPRPGNEELVDLAVSLTLANRGKVFPIASGLLPPDAAVAATFRYPVPAPKAKLAKLHVS